MVERKVDSSEELESMKITLQAGRVLCRRAVARTNSPFASIEELFEVTRMLSKLNHLALEIATMERRIASEGSRDRQAVPPAAG